MNNDELKEYIDQVEKRANKALEIVMQCTRDLKKNVEDIKSFELQCPIVKKVNKMEVCIAQVKSRVFKSNILVLVFLGISMFLLKLHLFSGKEIQPRDVLAELRALEQKIDKEIVREQEEDKKEEERHNKK